MRGKPNYQGKCCTEVQQMVIEQHVRKEISKMTEGQKSCALQMVL